MTIFDLFFNKVKKPKNNNITKISNKLNDVKITYPKNTHEEEIEQLYSDIRKADLKEKLQNKYVSNALKNNRYLQKQQSTFITEKQKYKELENNFNKMMEKGNDIFKND